jgi:hypothetical protein
MNCTQENSTGIFSCTINEISFRVTLSYCTSFTSQCRRDQMLKSTISKIFRMIPNNARGETIVLLRRRRKENTKDKIAQLEYMT